MFYTIRIMETKKGQATETICLYNSNNKTFIAELFEDDKYEVPNEVEVFLGTKEQFKQQYPDYEYND